MQLPYTPEESESAHNEWQASCGHHSIAAACYVSLQQVKEACPDLCGWMAPTMVSKTLEALGKCPRQYKDNRKMDPPPGHIKAVMRVQFEGPWTGPGRPAVAAYEHTHYVAITGNGLVMDTANDPNALLTWKEWESFTDAFCSTKPRCTGWHFSHIWLPDDAT